MRRFELAEEVARWVREAHEALQVIDPRNGQLNLLAPVQKRLGELGKKLEALGTTYAKWAGSYLQGLGQKIVEERQEVARAMRRLHKELELPFETLEQAAELWQLDKQLLAGPWPGTAQKLRIRIGSVGTELLEKLGEQMAPRLVQRLFAEFDEVLSASSLAEWVHSRTGAVVKPQKRLSSGFLTLRVAYLNLTRFRQGRRKGQSPHELLTGEKVEDWLEMLGYPPALQPPRSYKQLGWKRLVQPFEVTWRQNWLRPGQAKLLSLSQHQELAAEAA